MSFDAGVTSATGAVPLTVYGLLQHEAKLSVVNFSMKKAASYTETIRNKEELLLVCGLRSFTGQPVLSDDAQGADKNKMERFLHPGKTAVGSLYAPISFPPLPLLAFKVRSIAQQPFRISYICVWTEHAILGALDNGAAHCGMHRCRSSSQCMLNI